MILSGEAIKPNPKLLTPEFDLNKHRALFGVDRDVDEKPLKDNIFLKGRIGNIDTLCYSAYFDQHLGAIHSKRWSKYAFSTFFKSCVQQV